MWYLWCMIPTFIFALSSLFKHLLEGNSMVKSDITQLMWMTVLWPATVVGVVVYLINPKLFE